MPRVRISRLSYKEKIASLVIGAFLAIGVALFYYYSIPNIQTVFAEKCCSNYNFNLKQKVKYFVSNYHSYQISEFPIIKYTHLETPSEVRAIYMSAWSAGNYSSRVRLIDFVERSDTINSVVIDIKDSTGRISYQGDNKLVTEYGSYSNRISNIKKIIKNLHEKNIYVIGRIVVFEDPYLAGKSDKFVLKDTNGKPWKNHKGVRGWIDPSEIQYHQYIYEIAKEAAHLGFDEINLDYVRYPSEGSLENILIKDDMNRRSVMKKFFESVDAELRKKEKMIISADVFGLTTTANNDLGIGQIWEDIIPLVDYIAPMIYPSHYTNNSFGYENPAEYPYQIIKITTKGAIEKTEKIGQDINKLRPWIQDFNLGAIYDASKIQLQIKALNDVGVKSYMSWDPRNIYTQKGYNN